MANGFESSFFWSPASPKQPATIVAAISSNSAESLFMASELKTEAARDDGVGVVVECKDLQVLQIRIDAVAAHEGETTGNGVVRRIGIIRADREIRARGADQGVDRIGVTSGERARIIGKLGVIAPHHIRDERADRWPEHILQLERGRDIQRLD